jgi:hypothetical protein
MIVELTPAALPRLTTRHKRRTTARYAPPSAGRVAASLQLILAVRRRLRVITDGFLPRVVVASGVEEGISRMSGLATPSDPKANVLRRASGSVRAEPELLARVGLFADLSAAELLGMAALMRPRPYARDEVIYLRGDPGTAFYVIVSG